MSILKTEDALLFLVEYLRKGPRAYFGTTEAADYGYDVYMLNPMRAYYREHHRADLMQERGASERIAPPFLDAAWELVVVASFVRAFVRGTPRQRMTEALVSDSQLRPSVAPG